VVNTTMSVTDIIRKELDAQAPDVLRAMLERFIAALMSAEADAICGAPYGEVTTERTNRRNGYRHRPFDTRVGTLDVAIPKLREGSYYPDWLLTPRRRAEKALTAVIATSYLLGVSTRRMEKLAQVLGIEKLSKSQALRAGQEPGRGGRRLPEPPARRRALHLRAGSTR
jgi:transposase-like protein